MNIFNKFKRGLAGLLSLSVAVSAVFVFHFPLIRAHAAEDEHDHEGWTALTSTDGLPKEAGNYYLEEGSDFEISETWKPANGTYLCLNGNSITMTDDGAVISVGSKVEFTLYDCENKGTITHEEKVKGCGVQVDGGTFNMYGGKISENTVDGDGGGVVVSSGVFNMYGGEISGNNVSANGGGVFVSDTFNMYGGTISSNYGDSENGNGGGVYNSGKFKMSGGDISSNKVNGNGGGVYNDDSGTFEMLDGDISSNTAYGNDNRDDGVYAGGTSFTVGGKAKIVGNNVYLPSGMTITISSEIPLWGEDTKIYVTTEDQPTEASDEAAAKDVVIAKPENGENYRKFFESNSSYNVIYDKETKTIKFSSTNEPDENDGAIEPEDSEPVTPPGTSPGTSESDNPSKPDESGDSGNTGESGDSGTSGESGDSGTSGESGDSGTSGESGDPGTKPTTPSHSHGESDGNPWEPFDKAKFESESGFYYLEKDVELEETLKPADGTYLCLNGKKLIINKNKPAISVTGEFTLCDDEGGGLVTHGENGGVGVSVDGGTFAIYGGTINGNKGYGVTLEGNGTLTVGGTAKILNEVYLLDGQYITIDDKKPLDGAEIFVKTETSPAAADGDTPAVNIPITNANKNVDYSEFFHSNTSDYIFINETTTDGDVVFLAVKTEENQKHIHGGVELAEWTATDRLPDEGNYYLADNVTLSAPWVPKAGTHLCLNGKTIIGTISVTDSGVTLYNCKSTGSANVTVSADKTINVGGTLKANITLNDGALINVDGDNKLTTGASITVALVKALADGESKAITAANNGGNYNYFHSANSSYAKKISGSTVVFEKPKKEEPPVVGHIHPICGIDNCRDHIDLEWTEWNSSTTLPTTAGSYYLTGNVTLSSRWNAASDIDLCLNGFTITMNANDTAVYVTHDLALCDCNTRSPEGAVTHASGKTGRGVYIASGGSFTMYGGTIKGNRTADGAGVYNDGTFTMRGGDITGNTATDSGGGLYNNGVAEIEGSIFKNSADKKGGGVYQDGKFTVNKDAYIMNNTVGSSSRNNVYLTDGSQIVIGGTSFDGEVGVTLETNPRSSESVIFAKGSISSSTAKKLVSDSSSYTVKASGGRLTLSKKSSTTSVDDDDSDLELEISAPLSSASVPQADRTAIINLLKTMPEWVVGVYYDVTLYEDGDEISEADESISVKLTIPTSIRAANRVYKVIRVHDDKAEILDSTTDSNKNTITVKSRYFSTYAIIYSASQSSSGNGSGSGSNGGYVNPSMGVQNEIPLAGLACGFTVLALAAPGKKIDQ